MADWKAITKLNAMSPLEMGISEVRRLVPRNSGAGLALGFSEFKVGSMEMETDNPELFIVLEGCLEITADGVVSRVEANEALWMPAGSKLQITVDAPTRVLYVIDETPE